MNRDVGTTKDCYVCNYGNRKRDRLMFGLIKNITIKTVFMLIILITPTQRLEAEMIERRSTISANIRLDEWSLSDRSIGSINVSTTPTTGVEHGLTARPAITLSRNGVVTVLSPEVNGGGLNLNNPNAPANATRTNIFTFTMTSMDPVLIQGLQWNNQGGTMLVSALQGSTLPAGLPITIRLMTVVTNPAGLSPTGIFSIRITSGSTTHFDNSITRTLTPTGSSHLIATTFNFRTDRQYYFNPTITASPDIHLPLGSIFLNNIRSGLAARTGFYNSIIPINNITTTVLNEANVFAYFVSTGNTINRIGSRTVHYEIRDSHSTSAAAAYVGDNTMAPAARKVTVSTPLSPTLTSVYGTSAVNRSGTSITGSTYNAAFGTLPCGGEDGWTNQPLNLSTNPGTIVGTFDSVLRIPSLANTVVTNGIAIRSAYNTQSATTSGTTFSGLLTEVGVASNELSGIASGTVKIDTTPPVANATYMGGYQFINASSDELSGLSTSNPTLIAFTTPSGSTIPPLTGWDSIDNNSMQIPGTYDVWIRATDKAGNITTIKTHSSLFIGGNVAIEKNTDYGAVLHDEDCTNYEHVTIETGCGLCSVGARAKIKEKRPFVYVLTLRNEAITGNAMGTFEDYLPLGVTVIGTPTVTPSGSATVTSVQEVGPPYDGRYKISGTYTNIAPGAEIQISIPAETPAFDETPGAINIISNQATTSWSIGPAMAPITGNNKSNYANHEVISAGVHTSFTKVSADALTTGLSGAEFALYRWDGALPLTQAEEGHMVDVNELVDSTLSTGNWVRVTYSGETATSLADVFLSATTPSGEVDFGKLEEGVYTLIETKAPEGYEIPIGQWIVTIAPDRLDSGDGDYKIEFVGKSHGVMPPAAIRDTGGTEPTYRIINARPFSIGLSGLSGSTRMLLLGFILMTLAGNIYMVHSHKQRKQKEE